MGRRHIWAIVAIAAIGCEATESASGGPDAGGAEVLTGQDGAVTDAAPLSHSDSMASCEPLLESYEAAVALLAADHAACQTDADCAAVDLYAPCQSLCDRAVAASQVETFRADFAALSQTYCAEMLAKGCGHVDHACDTAPRCVAGACTAEPPERGEDTGGSKDGGAPDTATDA